MIRNENDKQINAGQPITQPTDTKNDLERSNLLLEIQQCQSEKVSSSKMGIFHQICLASAVLLFNASAGMPIGYPVVILPQLYNSTDPLSMDLESGSWFVSIHSLATLFGSISSGPLMDFYGRKPSLMFAAVPFLIGWLLIATASSYLVLLLGRIFAGFAVGSIAATPQIFVAECSEPKLRGILISLPNVSYSFGILVTYSFGLFLSWRNAAWSCTFFPIVGFLSLILIPESPIWLARNKQIRKAEAALDWYRCNKNASKIEMQEILTRFEIERTEIKSTENIIETCKRGAVLIPLVIINVYHLLLIISGTYLIMFYAVDIIADLGAAVDSTTAAFLTSVIRIIFATITCYLLFHMNRRTLLICSGIGSSLSTLILAVYLYWRRDSPKTSLDLYVAAICILIYIATNTGLMILSGVMVGELLPAKVRGRVAALIFAVFNIILFVNAKMFPFFITNFQIHGIFLMFSLACFGIVISMYYMLPETKDRTLGEIEDYFNQYNWLWTKSSM